MLTQTNIPPNPQFYGSYKAGLRDLMLDYSWQKPVFMTFAFNCHKVKNVPVDVDTMIAYFDTQVKNIDAKIARSTLGRNFAKKVSQRATGYGFREHVSSNYHIHFILDIRDVEYQEFSRHAKQHLIDTIPSATFDIQEIEGEVALKKCVEYVLKEQSHMGLMRRNGYLIMPNTSII